MRITTNVHDPMLLGKHLSVFSVPIDTHAMARTTPVSLSLSPSLAHCFLERLSRAVPSVALFSFTVSNFVEPVKQTAVMRVQSAGALCQQCFAIGTPNMVKGLEGFIAPFGG